ncbi:lipoprotein [Legionella geestiana]|uniref:Lipoprotein n=1 Tax=Legionella geestiana TaxID=45065 RepID=A0A0W0U9E4_9GAMM|nr:DegV family protein [Legionella geestiana]KTD04252.1 lipoprotein [Legionella geestiana]QBS11671.1 DegV family protein [Legionella geestiana]QDQ40718.1 DegV family EDD domain-containing protein [Legionella geestiana]STX53643.1 DAK2 domain protein [Legionella geestiana]
MQSLHIEPAVSTLTCLDAKTLHAAICWGCEALVNARESLNSINVFPVADGDTGDNMASTARAILEFSRTDTSMERMLHAVADASVLGAHGNSGIIFSQFFNALSSSPITMDALDTPTFARLLEQAASGVRASLANPMEGTMLTLIDVLAMEAGARAKEITCFKALHLAVMPALERALNNTEQQLPELSRAHVVDAGALGFYRFMEGFVDCLQNPSAKTHAQITEIPAAMAHTPNATDTPPNHRYCTEAILRADSIDQELLTQRLCAHGDSVVLTGNVRICRFHLHTDTPWKVFENLFDLGTLEYPKVDDMQRQYEMHHTRKYPIALVTDTSADLPASVLDAYQVHQIPISIHYNNHTLLDRLCLESGHLYATMGSLDKHPTTSLPSLPLMEEKLSLLSREYEQVLVLSLSGALSGTHDALVNLSKNFNNVTVVDSGMTSGGLGLLVEYAARLIAEGQSLTDIKAALESARENVAIYVLVENFDALKRSGRVGRLTAHIGRLSGLKPIITVKPRSKGSVCGGAFSLQSGLERLVALIQKKASAHEDAPMRYGIMHAGAPELAEELRALATKTFKTPPAFVEQASAAIGLHAGQGAVAIAALFE